MTSGLLFSRSQKYGSFTGVPCQTEMCSTCLAVGGEAGTWAKAAVESEKKTLAREHSRMKISFC